MVWRCVVEGRRNGVVCSEGEVCSGGGGGM